MLPDPPADTAIFIINISLSYEYIHSRKLFEGTSVKLLKKDCIAKKKENTRTPAHFYNKFMISERLAILIFISKLNY